MGLNKQLFITDDNRDFASFLEGIALKEDWVVTICSDGSKLVESLSLGQDPVFVLLDVFMPKLSGIETMEKLIGIGRPLRLRFITGVSEVEAMAAQMIASARGFNIGRTIYKPVSTKEFRLILQEERQMLMEF